MLPAHTDALPAWQTVCGGLRRRLGDSAFDVWLAPITVASWDGRELCLQVPEGARQWLTARYGDLLERCVREVLGETVTVRLLSDALERSPRSRPGRPARLRPPTSEPPQPTAGPARAFNPRYSFDQFIIGEGNRLAHAAALAVSELPGQAYNPLFVHAAPGLGKTHLLHAIGNYVLAFGGATNVRYTTTEDFTNHFMGALATRAVEPFKRAYRDADVLLIDDVQFLASKARTEEEFFHTFNALYEAGRQLVITCDRLPRALAGIETRLRERFEAGLVAEIAPPDLATRITILRKRAALDGIRIADPQVLELIAERITTNIRSLEGALIRVVAHHSLTQRPLDVALATDVLDVISPAIPEQTPSIDRVQTIVAAHYSVSTSELVSSSRATRINWPRQVAIHIAREVTDASLQTIGEAFGGRNHGTVLHACKRVQERVTDDHNVAAELRVLTERARGRQADRDC